MASISTTLGLAPSGDNLPEIRTSIWIDAKGTTCAAVAFQLGFNEVGFNGSAEQIDQILRNGLNALGEALDAHDATEAQAVPS